MLALMFMSPMVICITSLRLSSLCCCIAVDLATEINRLKKRTKHGVAQKGARTFTVGYRALLRECLIGTFP